MHNPKYDVFVCSHKKPDPTIGIITEGVMVKLYNLLRCRLNAQGFGNAIVDTMRYTPIIELDAGELQLLKDNPFYLSEHYLTQRIELDPQHQVIGLYRAPWNTRPSMEAYTYAERGQRPMFHAMVIGCVNSGKTYVLNEFKLLLNELVPGIEVIECDNDVKMPDYWDITSDPECYKEYGDRIKMKAICIGNGPSTRVGIDNQMHHNTKI